MPFITKSSLNRVHTKIRLDAVPDEVLVKTGKVWYRVISQLSRLEIKSLLLQKALYVNPSAFVEIYNKSDKIDTFTYLDETNASRYHRDANCEYLNSNFKTFLVPKHIRNRSADEVKSFRAWYKQNINRLGGTGPLGEHKPDFFEELVRIFGKPEESELEDLIEGVDVKNIEAPVEKPNVNLTDLAYEIDWLVDELWEFFQKQKLSVQDVIKLFGMSSKLGYSENSIINNPTSYSEESIKKFLRGYHEKYKKPLIESLREYYRVYFNPELEFDGPLLEMLNFKPCSYRYHKY